MNIKSIETKRVTEDPFSGLCETETKFAPYYQCKIITDNGNASAKGSTVEEAEAAALELLKTREANKVQEAYTKYLSDNGIYFVDC